MTRTIIHSFPDSSSSTFDITQGYLQYAGGPLTVIGGKFTTLHGTEVIWSPSNANYSRSLLFGSVPFTHTGVRGTFAVGDYPEPDRRRQQRLGPAGRLEQGQDASSSASPRRRSSRSRSPRPTTAVAKSNSGDHGPERPARSFNFVASYTVIDPLSVGFEYLTSQAEGRGVRRRWAARRTASTAATPSTVSARSSRSGKLSLRAESLDDKDGFQFPLRHRSNRRRNVAGTSTRSSR